ncbi:MAG: Ig-like domain-containing protein, partial [Polyangiaceae bacterium]
MKTLKNVGIAFALTLVPACGEQLVEFSGDPAGNGGNGASAGTAGSSGTAGTAGAGGSGGAAGSAGTGGSGGAAGSAGTGGTGGTAGTGGTTGSGGTIGTGGVGGLFTPDSGTDSGTDGGPLDGGICDDGGCIDASVPPTPEAGTPPEVSGTNPTDGDLQVALNKTIFATFDEDMALPTMVGFNFTVDGPGLDPTGAVL